MNEINDILLPQTSETTEVIRNFATIGEVFVNGVSLIFDGEETATEKHYLCNTNAFFSPGDRVRILADSGTYIVEYVVGAPRQTEIVGIPAGGGDGAVLTKASNDDHDVEWENPSYVPTSGTTGYVLTKTSSGFEWQAVSGALPGGGNTGDFLRKTATASEWAAIHEVPTTGTTGYVLTKTASGYAWQAVPVELPATGTTGNFLRKTAAGSEWAAIHEVPATGTTGYVLTKTSSGYAWQAVPTEIPASGTTGYVLTKTSTGFAWQASPTELPSIGTTGYFLRKTSSGSEWVAIHEVPAAGTTGYVLTKTAGGYTWQAAGTRAAELINSGASAPTLENNDIMIRSTSSYTSTSPVFEIKMKGSSTWKKITIT